MKQPTPMTKCIEVTRSPAGGGGLRGGVGEAKRGRLGVELFIFAGMQIGYLQGVAYKLFIYKYHDFTGWGFVRTFAADLEINGN